MRRRLRVALLGLGLFAVACGAVACGGGDDGTPTSPTPTPPQGPANLVVQDLVVGQGAEATGTKAALLHYALWLYDPVGPDGKGRQIDSSRARGQTYAFRLGTNSVIPGFEQGVTGMRVGGMRRVTIPPTLAYGSTGSPPNIPGNAWLVFELELLDVAD